MKKIIEKYTQDPTVSFHADVCIISTISLALWFCFNSNFSAIKTVNVASLLESIGIGLALLVIFLVGIYLSAKCKMQLYLQEFENVDFDDLNQLTNNVFKLVVYRKLYLAIGFIFLNFLIAIVTGVRADGSVFNLNSEFYLNKYPITFALFLLMFLTVFVKFKADKLSSLNRQILLPELKVQAKLKADKKAKELAEIKESEKHLPWYKKQF